MKYVSDMNCVLDTGIGSVGYWHKSCYFKNMA